MVLNGNRKIPRLLHEIRDVNHPGVKDKELSSTRSRGETNYAESPDFGLGLGGGRCPRAPLTHPASVELSSHGTRLTRAAVSPLWAF